MTLTVIKKSRPPTSQKDLAVEHLDLTSTAPSTTDLVAITVAWLVLAFSFGVLVAW